MINKMKLRKGGYRRGVSNSAMYQLKLNPEGDAIDCSIERLDGESNQAYANRIEKIFESARVPNQQNLYQFNSLSLHPSEGDKFTDAQMIEMAKEVYLRNGVKNGLTENRHTMFVVERNTKHHHVHAMIHLTDLETKKVNNKMIDYNPIIKKLELKYGLYNEHRKPKDESEYKKTFKKELKAILDNALTASEFLMLANAAGFDIHHSGKDAYSLTKDDQTFKASDLAVSYKTLKATLGDDPEFAATLALLHKDKPGNDGSTSIKAPTEEAPAPEAPTNQPQKKPAPAPAPDHEPDQDENGYSDYGSQSSEDRRKERADYFKGIRMQKTLYKNYHHDEDGNYYFNRNNMKAFEFDASSNTVTHRSATPSSVKAGLQKLTEDGKPCSLYTKGGEKYKRETWLQFHLMKLDEKGYTLAGFKPSKQDLELLEQKLADQTKFYNRKEESNVKALPTQSAIEKPVVSLDKKENEKPAEKITDTESKNVGGAVSNIANGAVKVAAGVLDGAVDKMADMTQSFSAGTMEEKLSEMRALDAGIQTQKNEAEDVHYQNERRRRNMPRPD
ncbi:TPA: relaxase [Pseudomonas sp. H2]|uniref:relaxase/mobilization nuclease domain-containing protein n=1 Tax=Pseudomonas sp. H2 TaxID=658612 RepID=UPI000AB8473C|nr:relaxase [Pseudomonas sp. H2]